MLERTTYQSATAADDGWLDNVDIMAPTNDPYASGGFEYDIVPPGDSGGFDYDILPPGNDGSLDYDIIIPDGEALQSDSGEILGPEPGAIAGAVGGAALAGGAAAAAGAGSAAGAAARSVGGVFRPRPKWYEKAPGQTRKKALPDGVEYNESAGIYRWTAYDKNGKAVERVAVQPPTAKQLARSRQNFNRSRGILKTGIGARSQQLDVKEKPASQPEHYIGQTDVQKTWDGRTEPPQPPFQDGKSIPNMLPYNLTGPMKMGPPNVQPQQPSSADSGGESPLNVLDILKSQGEPEQQPPPAPQQPPQEQPTPQADMGVQGSQTTAQGISKPDDTYEMNWRVMELGQVIPSHDSATMQPRADYPSNLQPRDRERKTSDAQIGQIAKNLSPSALLDDTHALDAGAPIVGPEGVVESGSGRTMAVQRAAAQHPDRYQAYVDQLKQPETLSRIGITGDQLSGIQQPILVRERTTEMDQAAREAFTREANAPRAMATSTTEQAMQHASAFTDQQLARLDIPDSATTDQVLTSQANATIASRYLSSYAPTELPALADSQGNLNKRGLDAMRESLFANVYGSDATGKRLSQELQENTDEDIKRVGNALVASLPAVARSEALVRTGRRKSDYSIAGDVSAAVQQLRALRRRGMSVDNYLRSYTIDDDGLTPTQKRLLVFFDRNATSPRKMSEFLNEYANFVHSQADVKQGAMLGTGYPSKEQFITSKTTLPAQQQQVIQQDTSFRARDEHRRASDMAAAAIGKQRRQGIR